MVERGINRERAEVGVRISNFGAAYYRPLIESITLSGM